MGRDPRVGKGGPRSSWVSGRGGVAVIYSVALSRTRLSPIGLIVPSLGYMKVVIM